MDVTRRFPIEVACDWIGNSPRIATKHYLGTTESDFAAATSGYESTVSKTPLNLPQYPTKVAVNVENPAEAESANFVVSAFEITTLTADSSAFLPLTKTEFCRAGIETTAKSRGKQGVSGKSAAKSAAVSAGTPDDVRELAAFLAKLPVNMREALMAVAEASRRDG